MKVHTLASFVTISLAYALLVTVMINCVCVYLRI